MIAPTAVYTRPMPVIRAEATVELLSALRAAITAARHDLSKAELFELEALALSLAVAQRGDA